MKGSSMALFLQSFTLKYTQVIYVFWESVLWEFYVAINMLLPYIVTGLTKTSHCYKSKHWSADGSWFYWIFLILKSKIFNFNMPSNFL